MVQDNEKQLLQSCRAGSLPSSLQMSQRKSLRLFETPVQYLPRASRDDMNLDLQGRGALCIDNRTVTTSLQYTCLECHAHLPVLFAEGQFRLPTLHHSNTSRSRLTNRGEMESLSCSRIGLVVFVLLHRGASRALFNGPIWMACSRKLIACMD